MRTSRLRKAISTLVVAILMIAMFGTLNFALELKGTKSNIVWTNFEQSENLDMVYIGTSIAASSFNPNLIDDEYGSSSANMASPMQKIEETYLGIQSAYAVSYTHLLARKLASDTRYPERERCACHVFRHRQSV